MWRETGMPLIAGDAPISDPGSAQITGLAPRETTPVFSFYRDFPGILIVLILKTSGMGKWYSWDFDCLILCAAFDCLITILPCVPPSPIYRQDVMTYIWNAALIAPFRGYMEEDQVTYVYCASWEVFRVMQSFGVALQTALRGVQRWPSAGLRRGQYAGSALLRNETVHTVLHGPRAVSSLVFCSRKACDG